MNRRVLFGFLAWILVAVGGQAFGDGLFRKLPSEGSWSKFRMSEEWSDGTRRDIDVTLKAFGKELVDDVECRWIELDLQTPDGKTRRAHRFLSPVASLETGADPLGSALDVWVRKNDGESRRDMTWDDFLPRLMIMCPPKISHERALSETELIQTQDASYLGSVVTGADDQKFYGGVIAVRSEYRLITNDSLPFGVGSAAVRITQHENCDLENPDAVCEVVTGNVRFSLVASGGNAKAAVQVADHAVDEPSDQRELD